MNFFEETYLPRWRVLFVFINRRNGERMLCEGRWWKTQLEAEQHALRFLEGNGSELYGFEHHGSGETAEFYRTGDDE